MTLIHRRADLQYTIETEDVFFGFQQFLIELFKYEIQEYIDWADELSPEQIKEELALWIEFIEILPCFDSFVQNTMQGIFND